jgi:hypothetical protein
MRDCRSCQPLGPEATGPTWQQLVLAKGRGYATTSPIGTGVQGSCHATRCWPRHRGQSRKLDDCGACAPGRGEPVAHSLIRESDTSVDARKHRRGWPLKLRQSHPDCVQVELGDRIIS